MQLDYNNNDTFESTFGGTQTRKEPISTLRKCMHACIFDK